MAAVLRNCWIWTFTSISDSLMWGADLLSQTNVTSRSIASPCIHKVVLSSMPNCEFIAESVDEYWICGLYYLKQKVFQDTWKCEACFPTFARLDGLLNFHVFGRPVGHCEMNK
jgi:hypothetical protein